MKGSRREMSQEEKKTTGRKKIRKETEKKSASTEMGERKEEDVCVSLICSWSGGVATEPRRDIYVYELIFRTHPLIDIFERGGRLQATNEGHTRSRKRGLHVKTKT